MKIKKKYYSPRVKVFNIETSPILSVSNSKEDNNKHTTNTSENKKIETKANHVVSSKITYSFIRNYINISIPLATGTKNIQEKTVIDPEGDRLIIYDSYIFTMKQFSKNATDIPYYIDKMQQALYYKNQNFSTEQIIIELVSKHISNNGRIIDGDLSMIISAVSRVTDHKLDTNFEWSCLDTILKRGFEDKLLFTIYNQTPLGMEPKLVTASQYRNM